MEKEGFDTFQSHSTTHIIAYTCALCLFCRPHWRIQLCYNRWTYLSHCVRTKMISRDLKFQCHRYSYWHCQEQSMDNESNCDKRQRERENGQWYQDFRAHEYTRSLSQTITQTLTPKHTRRMCVCVCVRARPCVLVLLLKGRAAAERVSLWQGTLTIHPRADSGNILASACAALWAHQRMSECLGTNLRAILLLVSPDWL